MAVVLSHSPPLREKQVVVSNTVRKAFRIEKDSVDKKRLALSTGRNQVLEVGRQRKGCIWCNEENNDEWLCRNPPAMVVGLFTIPDISSTLVGHPSFQIESH